MRRDYAFLSLLVASAIFESLTDCSGYSGPVLLISGICLLAHYRFIGGSYLTFRRNRHTPAAKAIAKSLIETRIDPLDGNHEQKLKLYRGIMIDGLNKWLIKRRLIHSFRLSLLKEVENQEKLLGSPSLLTAQIDPVIDNIVLCFDKDTTWR